MEQITFKWTEIIVGVPTETTKVIEGNVTYATRQNDAISQIVKRTADSGIHVYSLSPAVHSVSLRIESVHNNDAQWLYYFLLNKMNFREGLFKITVSTMVWLDYTLNTGEMIDCTFGQSNLDDIFTFVPPDKYDITFPFDYKGRTPV